VGLFQGESASKDAERIESYGAVVKHYPLYPQLLVKAKIARGGHHFLWPHVMSPPTKEVLKPAALAVGNSAFDRVTELFFGQRRGERIIVGHQDHFVPVVLHPALQVADDIWRMAWELFLQREKVLDIPYTLHRNAPAVFLIQCADDLADDPNVLAKSRLIAGVNTV